MSVWIDDIEVIQTGNWIKYTNVASECYDLVGDTAALKEIILTAIHAVDIITFGQRLPNTEPPYSCYYDFEEIAALQISTYEHWLRKQIIKENRKNINRALKKGISVRECQYDDDFVHSIMDIYMETPVRQGKKFSHFGKSFEIMKTERGNILKIAYFLAHSTKTNWLDLQKFF